MSWSSVRVPASSANLGPGFDALGLALGIYLECRFRESERLIIRVTGRDAEAISTGEDNLIWQTARGVARAVRLELPPHFGIAIVVPDFVLPTAEARAVLPNCYSSEDAIFNVQRAALLVAALAAGSTSAFPAAVEDRFHQPYRLSLVP